MLNIKHFCLLSLNLQLRHTLFLISGILGVQLSQAGYYHLLRARSHMQKSICMSLVNEKLNSLISISLP